LTFRYDKVGDILYLDKCLPYKEQNSEMLADEIGVRLNPRTGDIETVEIMWFTRRLKEGETIELPITGDLRMAI
jgi:hypothetical protein